MRTYIRQRVEQISTARNTHTHTYKEENQKYSSLRRCSRNGKSSESLARFLSSPSLALASLLSLFLEDEGSLNPPSSPFLCLTWPKLKTRQGHDTRTIVKVLICVFPPVASVLRLCEQQLNSQQKKPKHHFNHVQSGSSSPLQTPADSHVWSVNGWLEGQKKEQSERAGRGTGGGGWGGGTVSQPICSSSLIPKRKRRGREGGVRRTRRRRQSNTTPAILFLSSAATAFVAMATQADDLIAVTFECCSLKEPVTRDRQHTDATRMRTDCYMRRKHSCIAAEYLTLFSTLC